MRELNDLEHFVLQPGELLILRCKVPISEEALQRVRDSLKRHGLERVLVLPPDVEVMAGEIELITADSERPPVPTEEDVEALRNELKQRYMEGRTLYAWELGKRDGWFVIHHVFNPHTFDFDRFTYNLTKPEHIRHPPYNTPYKLL